jgi:DNA replication protein DnaC
MGTTQIRTLMHEMKLFGMKDAVDKTASCATSEGWGFFEFIDVLLQAEYESRNRRRTESRIKASKLKRVASFEDYDFTAKRSLTKAQLKEIQSLKWLYDGRPLVLIGQTGVGKTYLAHAAGLHACQLGKTVVCLSTTAFLEQLTMAKHTNSYLKFKERLTKPDLIILDDFGMRKFTAVEAEDLREILEERSYGKATLITTQLPLKHWAEVIPDPVLAEAIIDRIDGMALQIKITGDSYRPIKGKKLDSQVGAEQ